MDAASIFQRTARRHADRPFLADHEHAITYGDADRAATSVAAGLLREGVRPGDAVGLCSPDSVALLLHVIAVWKIGAIPAPIDPRTDDAALPYFLGDIDPVVIVSTDEHRDRLERAGASHLLGFGDLHGEPDAVTPAHTAASPLFWSYTSGSTGQPKACVIDSGPVTLGTACIAERLGLKRDDVLLATTPSSSSFQLVASLLPAIHVGAALRLAAGQKPAQLWDAAEEAGATVLVAYPLTLGDMVSSPRAHADHRFRLSVSGGSPVAPRLKREFGDRLGIPLVESYGQSEIGGFMALGHTTVDERGLAGFVGPSLPDRPAYVADPDGRELPVGEVGEVLVAEGFFSGYRNKPEATAAALAGGRLHCGDLAVCDADGHLKVLGRTREADNARRRGFFLRDIEDVAHDHPAVRHAAVVETQATGTPRIYVELRGDGAESAPEDLVQWVAARLGTRPDGLEAHVLDAMPRTFSGKADRQGLTVAG